MLALRYSCGSSSTLAHDIGFINVHDMAQHGDLTAVGVKDATVAMLKNLFIPTHCAPHSVTWFRL